MWRDAEIVAGDRTLPPPDAGRGVQRRRHRRRRRTAVSAAVTVALAVVGGVHLADDVQRAAVVIAADRPMIASEQTVLADLWRVYTEAHLEPGTSRTLDTRDDTVTTSEDQSNTMLRAVWMDDQQIFAESWQWTKDILQRDDSLLASRFGQLPDDSYDVLDQRSTSGADADVAFALLMAYSRWHEDDYLYDALPLIEAIWERSVVTVDGRPVLVADDLQGLDPETVLVNPSYLAPYAYRVFARVDPGHDWAGLVDSSYALLEELAGQPLDAGQAAGLPPDWVRLDRRTGEFSAPGGELTTRFGHEALRLPWRLALDHAWHGDERALRLLEGQAVLASTWTREDRLVAAYHRDGTPAADDEAPAVYGGAMGYYSTVRPDLADEVYADELLPLYDPATKDVTRPLGLHDSTWVWFGLALHLDELPNLNMTEE
jgi:endoglucanase